MIQVFLLGRFAVHRDGTSVARWGGRQTRDLVKVLAAAAGQSLSREQIAECLWQETPFEAERHVKVLVSRARRALGDDRHEIIVTTESGYLLNRSCWTDVREMERLAAQGSGFVQAGKPALARASYTAALDLYRGPFLEEDSYSDWVMPERECCGRLHVRTLSELGELLFAQGDRGAIEMAERLLAEDPYSETAAQALMASKARFGDVSAAASAYLRFRHRLLDELQTAPSPETDAVHDAILRGERPGWPQTNRIPQLSTSAEHLLVGREAELRVLEDALETAIDGRPTLVLVTGVAGIGKTRLLRALREQAAGKVRTLEATGRESDRHLPFHLLAEALRSLDVPGDELREAAGPYADVMDQLVPELAAASDARLQVTMSEMARQRVLDGFVYLAQMLAERRPLLFLFDDVHWADPSTVDALVYCFRRLRGSRVLCIVTGRSGEPEAPLDDRESLPNSLLVALAPLPADAVRALVGDAPRPVVDRIVAESEGIPFYVVELLRSLAESDASESVPSSIRNAIKQRVGRVSRRAAQILDAAAVLGDGFLVEAVGAVAGLPVRMALEALEELEMRQLIVTSPSAGSRFSHDLIRRSIYESMGAARRRMLHGLAADLLTGTEPAVTAHHALEAGRPDHAARLFREAGDAALSRFATTEAERLYSAALEAGQAAGFAPTEILDLLDRVGRVRSARGAYTSAAEAHRAALELAADDGTGARQKVRLGWIAYYQHQPDRATALGREAERAGDASTRGEGLLLQAKVAHAVGQVEQAGDQVTRASRLVGPEAAPEVRALQVAVANHLGRYEEAVLRFEGAVEPLRRRGHLRPLATLMLHGAIAMAGSGDFARAMAVLRQSAGYCREAGAEHLESRVPNTLGALYRDLGQPDRAMELYAESLELADRSGFAEALAHTLIGRAELAMDRGDTAAAERDLARAEGIVHDPLVFYRWRARLHWRLARSRLAILTGRTDDALHAAEATLVDAQGNTSPKYEVLGLLRRAEIVGPGEGGLDDLRRAFALAGRLNAPPLVWRAALALAGIVHPAERDRLLHLAEETAERSAGPLPDELRHSFLRRLAIGVPVDLPPAGSAR